jgi:hypothetical protein
MSEPNVIARWGTFACISAAGPGPWSLDARRR